MRGFKKRTLALILATTVSVVGAFGAENYKNSLMNISFENSANGLSMNIETKMIYSGSVMPIKKDVNTYVLMLPEINSLAPTPDLASVSNQIQSVQIRTMPYTNTAKGYTRITIKTFNPELNLLGQNKIYIATKTESEGDSIKDSSSEDFEESTNNQKPEFSNNNFEESSYDISSSQYNRETEESLSSELVQEYNSMDSDNVSENYDYESSSTTNINYKKDPVNSILISLFVLFIILCSMYFYSRAKTKLKEIVGESFELNNDETEDIEKGKKPKTINKVINNSDKNFKKKQIL